MPDMLVRLYALKAEPSEVPGVVLRRPLLHEKDIVKGWIKEAFGTGWASEFEGSFKQFPVTALIALRNERIVGFSCYEATCRGFFGPVGVVPSERGKGLGRELLVRALLGLRDMGYAYAIIGGAGPTEFYSKTVGAVPIEGSTPGIYPAPIREGG